MFHHVSHSELIIYSSSVSVLSLLRESNSPEERHARKKNKPSYLWARVNPRKLFNVDLNCI